MSQEDELRGIIRQRNATIAAQTRDLKEYKAAHDDALAEIHSKNSVIAGYRGFIKVVQERSSGCEALKSSSERFASGQSVSFAWHGYRAAYDAYAISVDRPQLIRERIARDD